MIYVMETQCAECEVKCDFLCIIYMNLVLN